MRTLEFGDDLGGYKIVSLLAREDAGLVYLAVDPVGTRLRLRVLSDVLLAEPFLRVRALEDLAKLQALQHPGVTRFVAWQEKDPAFYGVVDPGGAVLEDVVGKGRALDERELAWLAVRLAEALGALHAAGIPHGELSPRTVAVTLQGPVVIDLGWGPRLKSASTKALMARDVEALGDVLRFAADVDARTHRPGRAASPLAGEVAERLARAIASAPDGAAAARILIDAAADLGLGTDEPYLQELLDAVEGNAEALRPSALGRLFAVDEGGAAAPPAAAAATSPAPPPAEAPDQPAAAAAPAEAAAPPAEAAAAPTPAPPAGEAAAASGSTPRSASEGAGVDAATVTAVSPPPAAAVSAPPPSAPAKASSGTQAALPPPTQAASGTQAALPPPTRAASGTQAALPATAPAAPPRASSGSHAALPPPLHGKLGASGGESRESTGAGRTVLAVAALLVVALGVGYALGRGANEGTRQAESAQVEDEVRALVQGGKTDQARMRLLEAKQRGVRVDAELSLTVAEGAVAGRIAAVEEVTRRREAEEEAAHRRATEHAQELTREGQLALEQGQLEAARERFLQALRSDPASQEAAEGLVKASTPPPPLTVERPVIDEPRPAGSDGSAEAWRRERIDARLAAGQAALGQGDLNAADAAYREVLALAPDQADALRGMAELERARDEAEQREASRVADQLVARAQRALDDGRQGVAPLLEALEALDQAVHVAPSHAAARRERERLVSRLQLLLEERPEETEQLTGEGTGDPWLDVIEVDRVLIDRGLPGGVRFTPTRVFRPLRDEVREIADGRYRVLIRVRSQVARPRTDTPSPEVKIEATGLEVALEDKVARTCTPWEKIDLPGGPHYRTVRVDARGRILEPFHSAHGMDVKQVVDKVTETVRRLVAQAGKKGG